MTDNVIQMGGGWGSAIERMSDNMRARMAAADEEWERERAAEERQRAERAAYDEDRRIRASIALALERGEAVDIRQSWANGGVGRTRAEMISYVSAVQDVEDMRRQRAAQREIARIGEQTYYEQWTGDTSAHTEIAEREAREALAAKRQARYEARGRDQRTRAVARAAAQTEIVRYREEQLLRRWSA